ncbi:hypothetical protein DPEC_G00085310 [Dallia pectoralis]|uniref:Uncharacterized protein n=1 Tax=Dallia pectoralis TaxID=75939 RepID=A0ACC2H049_DALPE|nr:hypothetical protein DPEC_G00085310 [Dallia pectoralis]
MAEQVASSLKHQLVAAELAAVPGDLSPQAWLQMCSVPCAESPQKSHAVSEVLISIPPSSHITLLKSPSRLSSNADPLRCPVGSQRHPKDNISLKEASLLGTCQNMQLRSEALRSEAIRTSFNWRGKETSTRAL